MEENVKCIHLPVKLDKPPQFNGRSVENGQPVTLPLDNLDELLAWQSNDSKDPGQIYSVASVPYTPKKDDNSSKTLLCHDMKGGYLQDRFVQGKSGFKAHGYFMEYWSLIDVFVYFSHHFITVPPVGWVNACHRNGVAALGTLITELDSGYQRWRGILSNESIWEMVVEKLVQLAIFYGFDGWLLNVENEIDVKAIPKLVEFVKILTKAMHKASRSSLVIWYDSVTKDGKLDWQNELNLHNSCFYDVCDGIFLNYTWNSDNLAVSRSNCRSPSSVYVGIDVFGRGCYGGGGFNSKAAISIIRKFNLSVALFAPGWVWEVLGEKDFEDNNRKFWEFLDSFCFTRALDVEGGFSTRFYKGMGKVEGSTLYYDVNAQTSMPILPNRFLSLTDDGLVINTDLRPFKNGHILLFKFEMSVKGGKASVEIPLEGRCAFVLDTDVGKCFLKQEEEGGSDDDNEQAVVAVGGSLFEVKFIVGSSSKLWLISCASSFTINKLSAQYDSPQIYKLAFLQILPKFPESDVRISSESMRCTDVDWKKDDKEDKFLFGCSLVFANLPSTRELTLVYQQPGNDVEKGDMTYLGSSCCPQYRVCNVQVENPQFHGPGCYILLVAIHCSGIGKELRKDKLKVTYAMNT